MLCQTERSCSQAILCAGGVSGSGKIPRPVQNPRKERPCIGITPTAQKKEARERRLTFSPFEICRFDYDV
jgi:hypothetical protein